ncbi:hypothetical protein F383_29528 [Gossypium arboreum]|uniref:Uncharacterized protein n=1 Tax=Gossypium arboreum TaxID=29729 RepID=A0A0B0PCW3_GOSAR|nr:hypothetical protein F383_29528 [Gossypium arboreum]
MIGQGNRDLGLNRENTRLWTKLINCRFRIRVFSGRLRVGDRRRQHYTIKPIPLEY